MIVPVREDILPVGSRSIPWAICRVLDAKSGNIFAIAARRTLKYSVISFAVTITDKS